MPSAASLLSLLSIVSLHAQDSASHEFLYRASTDHKTVHLAGTFNNWDKGAWPMKPDADSRTWRFTATLEPGKHLYKFVLDGETWIVDPQAKRNEDDGGGNTNSVLVLEPNGYEVPAKIGDGRLTPSVLKHDQEPPFVNWDRGFLELKLRCRPNDAERVELWMGSKIAKMQLSTADDFYAYYTIKVPWDRKRDFDYLFALWDKKAGVNLGANGIDSKEGVIPYRISASDFKPIVVPSWPERTVLYQIFPDRFENGDPSNDPQNVVAWDAAPTYYNFFGGDFAGVQKRLPHLASLGIGAIYFNPIFKSPSNHGYETIDYHLVEPRFGTNDEFIRLTQSLDRAKIKVILDGVFNHCATTFPPFADLIAAGPSSEYKSWFYPKSFPIKVQENPPYEAWFGFPSMPKVNLLNPATAEYMLNVPKFWHERAKIAGWRLDVANEVPMSYWRDFRRTVKALRSDMWILGEHWGDSNPWLKGDQWDASMNYPWRDAMIQFVANGSISASEFGRRLMANYGLYVPQVSRNQMNLLSSHDTPRFLTLCQGDRKLQMLAAAIQLSWPGTPSIYYGEELGMEGGRDPENRKGTEWHRATPSNEILGHYRKLVKARNSSRALQSGEPVMLHAEGKTIAFARVLGDEAALTAANRSEQPVQISMDLRGKGVPLTPALRRQGFDNVLGGGRVSVSSSGSILIRLEPKSAMLLVPAKNSSPKLAVGGRRLTVRARIGKAARTYQHFDSFSAESTKHAASGFPNLPTANRQLLTQQSITRRHYAHQAQRLHPH